MKRKTIHSVWFKAFSVFVAFAFLVNQFAWAGDLIDIVLERQREEQIAVFAPSYIKSQQEAAQNLVNIQNDIVNFNLPGKAAGETANTNQEQINLKGPQGAFAQSAASLPKSPHGFDYDRTAAAEDGWTYYYLGTNLVEKAHTNGDAVTYEYQKGLLYRETTYGQGGRKIGVIIYGANGVLQREELKYGGSGAYIGKTVYYSGGTVIEYDSFDRRKSKTTPEGDYYTYYINAANRPESKTLASPDDKGSVYYHYMDESFYPDGTGRIDKEARKTKDELGAMGYQYDYTTSVKETMVSSGDVNGNGLTDMVLDFGPQYGIWIKHDDNTWMKIHSQTSKSITMADIDGNGRSDVIVDFGASGIWIWYDNNTWRKIASYTSNCPIAAGRIDVGAKRDVVIDLGKQGIWAMMNNISWTRIRPAGAEGLIVADLDNNGRDEVIADFGPLGLQMYDNKAWRSINTADVKSVAAQDIDKNGRMDLVVDIGASGIWFYMNKTGWVKYLPDTAESMTLTDIDENGVPDLLIDFGGLNRYLVRYNNDNWAYIDPVDLARKKIKIAFENADISNPSNAIMTNVLYQTEYNSLNRGVNTYLMSKDGFIHTNYRIPGNKKQDSYFEYKNIWQKTVEYHDIKNGPRRYAWLRDKNPGLSGDAVFYEYDAGGRTIRVIFDDGRAFNVDYTKIQYYETVEEINGRLVSAKNELGEMATFIISGSNYLLNTYRDIDGAHSSYEYYGSVMTGYTKTLPDGAVEVYNERGKMTQRRVPDAPFLKGSNLAWIDYGYDVGLGAGSTHIGFSSAAGKSLLYERFNKLRNYTVRLFLFCDLRGGMQFDLSGMPTGFTDKVYEDMRALLEAAKFFNIKLIPTLFDYGIADYRSMENGYLIGEHPDLIKDRDKRSKLLDIFSKFTAEFGSSSSVYAWDIINEPEYSSAVSIAEMRSFVKDFIALFKKGAPTALVTVGSRDRQDLVRYWKDVGLDLYQYHYYDNFELTRPLDFDAKELLLDKPVIIGELEPTGITNKLDISKTNGYIGGLFWEDGNGFIISDDGHRQIRDYFKGSQTSYYYYSDAASRLWKMAASDGTVSYYRNMPDYADGAGRLERQDYAGGEYKAYSYFNDGAGNTLVRTVSYYSKDNKKYFENTYDLQGKLYYSREYYPGSAAPKEVRYADGGFTVYDEAGGVKEKSYKNAYGDFSVYDGQNRLLRSLNANGSIKEYEDSKLIREISAAAAATEYFYDPQGGLFRTVEYLEDGSLYVLDKNKNIIYAFNIADAGNAAVDASVYLTTVEGDIIKYRDGKIVAVESHVDGALITNLDIDSGNNLKSAFIRRADGSVDVFYDDALLETIRIDGSLARYRNKDKVYEYLNGQDLSRYYYEKDAAGKIITTRIENAKGVFRYDIDGAPVSFKKKNNDFMQYKDGRILRSITQNNNIFIYRFEDGINPRSVLAASSVFDQTAAETINYEPTNPKKISSITTRDGKTYDYEEGRIDGITGFLEEITIEDNGIVIFDNGKYRKYYDEKGVLNKITTLDKSEVMIKDSSVSEVIGEDGSRVLYRGSKIGDLYDRKEGAHYEADEYGRPVRVTYDNGQVFTYTYSRLPDGTEEVVITDGRKTTVRRYKDDYLIWQRNASGVVSSYTYEIDPSAKNGKRMILVRQTKNNRIVGSYEYRYEGDKTFVTDMNKNIREYNPEGALEFLNKDDGSIYRYKNTEYGTLIEELYAIRRASDGNIVYYENGAVKRMETADGTVFKDLLFDDAGKLKTFTAVLAGTNEERQCELFDDGWTTVTIDGGAKLVFKGSSLAAVNINQMLVIFNAGEKIPSKIPLKIGDDPDALNYIDIKDNEVTENFWQSLLLRYGVTKTKIDARLVGGAYNWRSQSWWNVRGITNVNTYDDAVELTANIVGRDEIYRRGEAFIDLRYRKDIGGAIPAKNFENKKVSFYIKLEEGKLPPGGELLVDAFVKDSMWRSEYSTPVKVTKSDVWYQVTLEVSGTRPSGGEKDEGFNPREIFLAGVRVRSETDTSYNGKIFLKDANYQTINDGSGVMETPFFVSIDSIRPILGANIDWDALPKEGLPGGGIDLDIAAWRAQEYPSSRGVVKVTRDEVNEWWRLDLNLIERDPALNEGEMYVDLRYDVPGYKWEAPINLLGRTLTFNLNVPAGFPVSGDNMWAQVFVKDELNRHQYSEHVKIRVTDQWIELRLSPQFGEIKPGDSSTAPGFDPRKIVFVGIKISCNRNTNSRYNGPAYVVNTTSPGVFGAANKNVLVDVNALKKQAVDNGISITYERGVEGIINFAKNTMPSYFKNSAYATAAEYHKDGSVKSVLRGDSNLEKYDPKGRLESITDKFGVRIVKYTYNSAGEVVEINYSGIREKIRDDMQRARVLARQDADNALSEIGRARGAGIAEVDGIIDPALNDLYSKRSSLQSQWNEWNNKHFWRWDPRRAQKIAAMRGIEQSIGAVDRGINQLMSRKAELYAQVDAEVQKAKNAVHPALQQSLDLIGQREEEALRESVKQEVMEVVNVYYKDALGRNPTTQELGRWYRSAEDQGCFNYENRVVFDASRVKTALTTEDAYKKERADNDAFIKSVIAGVKSYLDDFKTSSQTLRQAKLNGLGIQGADISYDENDFEAVLKWLVSNNRHFGKSAFIALKEIFSNNNISVDMADMAVKLVLMDIFTSSINSLTSGEMEISMYAMSKYAERKNLILYNTKIDTSKIDALKEMVQNNRNAVIRVQGSHLIVIKSIDADGTVRYVEPSAGPNGELMTMKTDDLLQVWDGYAITERGPPPDGVSRVLTSQEAMQIRASDIAFVFMVISIISAIVSTALSFIDNEIAQLMSKIFGIISLVTGFVSLVASIGNSLYQLSKGLGNIGNILQASAKSVTDLFRGGINGFVNGMLVLVTKSIIGISLNYAYNIGLMTFGINGDIARVTSAFLSGGFMTPSAAGFSFGGGFAGLVVEGVKYAGNRLKIDPTITNIIGIAASTIAMAAIDGIQIGPNQVLHGLSAISKVIATTLLPTVAGELAYYGALKIGEMLGVDERISYLAGIGIRSSINVGLSGGTPSEIWTSVQNGLLQGVTSVAINYTGDALHLSPLLTGVAANVLGGAISGLFGIQQVDPNDPNHLITPANMFEGIANAFLRGLSSTMALGGTGGTDPWSQASHISQIFDFSSLVRQGGLLNAIDAYASAIFQQTAIEQMVRISTTTGSSGSVKKYIEDQLQSGNYTEEFEGDYTYKYIFLPGSENLDPYADGLNNSYIKIDDTPGREGIYGFAHDGYASSGEYYLMSDGSLGLDSGNVETTYEGNRYVQRWYSGDVQYTDIIGSDGYMGTFYSDSNYFSSMFANEGQFFGGTFTDESGSTITIGNDGNIVNSQRSITQEGVGQFTANLVEGLSYAYNTVEAMKMSAGQGALNTLLSDDYKHVTGPSAASLANYVGDNAKQYLKTYYGVQDEEFSTYAHLFGDVGDKVADLYGGYLKVQEIIGTAIVDGLTDGAYLGTEIPLIWDEVGRAFQSLKAGDTSTASELMGGVGVRLFREGSRVLEIVTLGMVAAGKAIAAETTEAVGTNIVKPLSSASKLKFGSDDLVYGIYRDEFYNWQKSAGGVTLNDIIKRDFGGINNLPVSIQQYTVNMLDEAATLGRTVRFDLTYVNDLNGVLRGTAYPNAVTSTELRHIYSNWDKFKNVIKFYKNGKEIKPW